MNDGVAYLLRLKFLLERDNLPLPKGIVLAEKMYGDIEHAYPVAAKVSEFMDHDGESDFGVFAGVKIYKEKKGDA